MFQSVEAFAIPVELEQPNPFQQALLIAEEFFCVQEQIEVASCIVIY
jgi:hypothetical protein